MSIILHPHTEEAKVAIAAVKKSMSDRKYRHYVQPIGKISPRGVVQFSHLNITTDVSKCSSDYYWEPSDWIKKQGDLGYKFHMQSQFN